jgi:hypothetical protein
MVAACALLSGAAACTAILGLDEKPLAPDAGSGGADSGTGCTADSMGYHAMANAACWATYDVSNAIGAINGLYGGTFDGRYVYFAPVGAEPFVRYDTQGAGFDATSSWTAYNPAAKGDASAYTDEYAGAVFDGRYVYFIPGDVTPSFLRFDTQGTFESKSAWTLFTLSQSEAGGYAGGTFDGRYIYFAPTVDPDEDVSALVTRYDTHGAFNDEAAAWAYFDATALSSNAGGFLGAVYDGRYAYFVPNALDGDSAVLVRYDTTSTFSSKAAWSSYDLQALDPDAVDGYSTAAFDGTNLYFAPAPGAPLLKKTAAGALDDIPSWAHIAPTSVEKKANSSIAAYDGRFVYFPPVNNGEDENGDQTVNTIALRYDTSAGSSDASQAAFEQTSSWSSFDTSTLPNKPENFGAAVFDGRYLYLASGDGSVLARFDAKEPPAQPKLPGYYGSFF